VSVHSIRLPKNSTVGDVLNDIKSKVFCGLYSTSRAVHSIF
jgi:hypothetical protein